MRKPKNIIAIAIALIAIVVIWTVYQRDEKTVIQQTDRGFAHMLTTFQARQQGWTYAKWCEPQGGVSNPMSKVSCTMQLRRVGVENNATKVLQDYQSLAMSSRLFYGHGQVAHIDGNASIGLHRIGFMQGEAGACELLYDTKKTETTLTCSALTKAAYFELR